MFSLRKRKADGSGRWYLVSVVNGRRFNHSLATAEAREAEQLAIQYLMPALARHMAEQARAVALRKQISKAGEIVARARAVREELAEALRLLDKQLEEIQ